MANGNKVQLCKLFVGMKVYSAFCKFMAILFEATSITGANKLCAKKARYHTDAGNAPCSWRR